MNYMMVNNFTQIESNLSQIKFMINRRSIKQQAKRNH